MLLTPHPFLSECFINRYGDRAGAELNTFLLNLQDVRLPFDLNAQMRQWPSPPFNYPDEHGRGRRFPGLPSKYYYFVPGTTYNGEKPFPQNPLAMGFVASVDGFGFNFGCPLRLHTALKIFATLPAAERREPLEGLAAATKHMSAVEELFATSIWDGEFTVCRPPQQNTKSHDWNILFPDFHFNQECKYIPALWPSMDEDFELQPGAFLAKASEQFPTAEPGFLNIVTITGVAPMKPALRQYTARELHAYPGVDAIVYVSIVGEMAVYSISPVKAHEVHRRIKRVPVDDHGTFSVFAVFRPERKRRQEARQKSTPATAPPADLPIAELAVESLPPRNALLERPPAAYPYRRSANRLPDGEPEFTVILPYPEGNNS